MRLKLNNDQYLLLCEVLRKQIELYELQKVEGMLDVDGALFYAIISELYDHFMNSGNHRVKEKRNISLKASWAITFFIHFNDQVDVHSHAGITLQKICNDIHREYELP